MEVEDFVTACVTVEDGLVETDLVSESAVLELEAELVIFRRTVVELDDPEFVDSPGALVGILDSLALRVTVEKLDHPLDSHVGADVKNTVSKVYSVRLWEFSVRIRCHGLRIDRGLLTGAVTAGTHTPTSTSTAAVARSVAASIMATGFVAAIVIAAVVAAAAAAVLSWTGNTYSMRGIREAIDVLASLVSKDVVVNHRNIAWNVPRECWNVPESLLYDLAMIQALVGVDISKHCLHPQPDARMPTFWIERVLVFWPWVTQQCCCKACL